MKNLFIIKSCVLLFAYLLNLNSAEFKLTEIFRFGGGEEALYGISDLIPLDDGSFIISDRLQNKILKVNREGELVTMTGRDGRVYRRAGFDR